MTENSGFDQTPRPPEHRPPMPPHEPPTVRITPPEGPTSGPPPGPPPSAAPPPSGYGASPGAPPPGYPGGYSGPPAPPPPGYPGAVPGGYPGAPGGYQSSDEKTWILIAHFGGAAGVLVGGGFLGWVAPLIAMMTKGTESPTVRMHAVEALNFQLTWAVAYALSFVLMICTLGFLFFVPLLVFLVPLIFSIIAGVKASNGEFYHYPMTVRKIT